MSSIITCLQEGGGVWGKSCPRRLPNERRRRNKRTRQSKNILQPTADQLSVMKVSSVADGHRRPLRGLINTHLSSFHIYVWVWMTHDFSSTELSQEEWDATSEKGLPCVWRDTHGCPCVIARDHLGCQTFRGTREWTWRLIHFQHSLVVAEVWAHTVVVVLRDVQSEASRYLTHSGTWPTETGKSKGWLGWQN